MGTKDDGRHALVFGASGLCGWAFVNELLSGYPDPAAFSTVTAFTNRPIRIEDTQWPPSPKLRLRPGLDLASQTQGAVESALVSMVPHLQGVTTVYFCAFMAEPMVQVAHMDSKGYHPDQWDQFNTQMLRKVVTAVEKLSPTLQTIVLPTGAYSYGIHLGDQFPFMDLLPLKETHPPLPEPHHSRLFYTQQLDLLETLSRGKPWKYFTVRPDVIIGFVPNNSLHNLTRWLALYLSLYRKVHGEGSHVVFPGTRKSWSIQSNDSGQDIIARFAIHMSLRPDLANGDCFNVADNPVPRTWSEKWPVICRYFGLVGLPPSPDDSPSGPDAVVSFLKEHQAEWDSLANDHGLRTTKVVDDNCSRTYVTRIILSQFDFDRPLDLVKMHSEWGEDSEARDIEGTWYPVLDRYRNAGIIP